MENKAVEIAKKIFETENVVFKHRLMGGMSNYTYVICVNDLLYTIRIPGENDYYFVKRSNELRDLFLFTKLDLTSTTVYFNLETGVKISKYVEGESLNTKEYKEYELVSELLKKVHSSNILCESDYNPFNKLEEYENVLLKLGCEKESEYLKVKEIFYTYKNYLENQKKVLCHNDSQPSNFILKKDSNLLIVDFEFVGNNDYMYDIACFGNMNMDDAIELVYVYHDAVTEDILLRLFLWRAFQCLQWYNVALAKELLGMSKTLNLDFKKISVNYLRKANDLLNICLNRSF